MELSSHQPSAAGTALVHISNFFFELADPAGQIGPPPDAYQSSGLVAAGYNSAMILTGHPDGEVRVTVEVYSSAPPVIVDGWEDVVEVTLYTDSGSAQVAVTITGDDAPGLPHLRIEPESWYGLRVHARGRHIGSQYVVAPPTVVEEYLLQMWPTDGRAAEVIHRKA
jgi:hypothetical protein